MNGECVQPLPLVLTIEEAAEALWCEPQTVVNYIHRHELDAILIGRERRIRGEDLIDFIRSRVSSCRSGKRSRGRKS